MECTNPHPSTTVPSRPPQVCKEHGVVYKNFHTFPSILRSVHAYIDTLALPKVAAPMPAASESATTVVLATH